MPQHKRSQHSRSAARSLSIGILAALTGLAAAVPAGATGEHRPSVHRQTGTAAFRAAASSGDTDVIYSDVPAKIEVGSQITRVRFGVGTRVPTTDLEVQLYDDAGRGYPLIDSFDSVSEDAPVSIWREQGEFYGFEVPVYGNYTWDVDVLGVGTQDYQEYEAYFSASVRAHSLLGLTTTRVGNAVTVTVATRVYNNAADKYQAWAGRGVYVQKQTPSGTWANVAGITTDSRGNGTKTIPTGAGVYRVYDKDTATVWGQVSAPRSS